MSLAWPWALLGLAALPLLLVLHRRARPAGERPFSAFFLLPDGERDGRLGGHLRAPGLLLVRALAALALVLAIAGPAAIGGGTVVVTDGPIQIDDGWDQPVQVVRAGRPPARVDSREIAPVVGARDWSGAVSEARRIAPGARVVLQQARRSEGPQIRSGAAALDGDQVVVTAAIEGDGRPVVRAGGRPWPMQPRKGDWFVRGALPAGPALIELEGEPGGQRWPLCIPDATPLTVADTGWPPAVEAVLDALPGVRRAPADEAQWRVADAPPPRAGWAPFAPPITRFAFAEQRDRAVAPLWFAAALPPPGAVVRRWQALPPGPTRAELFAGDRIVVDQGSDPTGYSRRFGFDPADTDLTETAGWPVLFLDALDHDRAMRSPCRVHRADRPLLLAIDGPVEVRDPLGRTRRVEPRDGAALLDGLDARGLVELRRSGRPPAFVAVVPALARPVPLGAVPELIQELTPARGLPLAFAGLLFMLAWLMGRGWHEPRRVLVGVAGLGAVAVGLIAAADGWPGIGGGAPGPVVIAVDRSGSMAGAQAEAAVRALTEALAPHSPTRVEGGARVQRVVEPGQPAPLADPEGPTRARPLLDAAARLAGPGGAVVWLSDGRAPDGPVASATPMFPLAVGPTTPDARVVGARALALGERVFVRAVVDADRPVSAQVRIDQTPVDLRLAAEAPRVVQAVVPRAGRDALDVVVDVDRDEQPGNDRLPVVVEGEQPARAVVVGDGAVGWARAAGLEPLPVAASGLAEAGARLVTARAMWVHDQPAGALPGSVTTRLRRWVEAGGVLLLAGREAAFGPGGWAGTPLDALSPLQADPRQPGAGRVALVLLVDRSGSVAREAGGVGIDAVGRLAGAVADGLRDADTLAVLAFGGAVETLLPPTAVGALRGGTVPVPALARGGTRLAPALVEARRILVGVPAEQRAVVVIGDGQVADGPALAAPARLLAEIGARVYVLATSEREPAVDAIARVTGGEARAVRPGGLRVDVRAAVSAMSGSATVAGGPVQAEAAWPGRVGGLPPPVERRVRVGARPQARVLARVAGEPLLAEWSIGRGRVIALATDAWALDAEQWAALMAPATAPRPLDARVTVDADGLWFRGAVTDPPPGRAAILGRGDREVRVAWRPVGPGLAWAPLPPGPVEVIEVDSASARGPILQRVVRPPAVELRRTGVDRAALALQASLTGGAVLSEPSDIEPVLAARRSTGGVPWAVVLAILTALALVLDACWWAGFRFRGARPS